MLYGVGLMLDVELGVERDADSKIKCDVELELGFDVDVEVVGVVEAGLSIGIS